MALLLIKEIILQQKKHGNGPTLIGLHNIPPHPEVEHVMEQWSGLLKAQSLSLKTSERCQYPTGLRQVSPKSSG